MFFYTSLFIASVIVALVILWLYNAIVDAGKVVYEAFLPSSKTSTTSHLDKQQTVATTVNDTPTPWGWKAASKPSTEARTHPARPIENAPWGWPGNPKVIREHGTGGDGTGLDTYMNKLESRRKNRKNKQARTGWPYREEMFEFAGKAYKVTRKVTPRKTNLKAASKPWGW
jgi:hypothetical protein